MKLSYHLKKQHTMTNKNIFLLLIISFFINTTWVTAQLSVGKTTPNTSAQLDVHSTTKGVLLPRVTLTGLDDTTTITNTNVESLMVYNEATAGIGANAVNPGFYYWSGSEWKGVDTVDTNPISKRIGEFVYAKSGRTVAEGYLAVTPGTIIGGATLYPLWAAQYPEFVSGVDIVFPTNSEGVFLRNTGNNAALEGTIQADATALANIPFTTNSYAHSHSTIDVFNATTTKASGSNNLNTAGGFINSGARTTATDTHNHTITGGGDIETRPLNISYQLYTIVDTY